MPSIYVFTFYLKLLLNLTARNLVLPFNYSTDLEYSATFFGIIL